MPRRSARRRRGRACAQVAVKSAEQQANTMLLTVRELLSRQRTQLVNALRGHATPSSAWLQARASKGVADLIAAVQDPACRRRPLRRWRCSAARSTRWRRSWRRSTRRCRRSTSAQCRQSRLLETIPGVGPDHRLDAHAAGRPNAVRVRSPLRGMARAGAAREVDGRAANSGMGGISRAGRTNVCAVAGAGGNCGDPPCQAWQQRGLSAWLLAIAGA